MLSIYRRRGGFSDPKDAWTSEDDYSNTLQIFDAYNYVNPESWLFNMRRDSIYKQADAGFESCLSMSIKKIYWIVFASIWGHSV